MIQPDGPTGDGEGGDPDSRELRPTRSQQTREATAVNRLGQRLSQLLPGELARLDLPERIREEIEVCRRLKPRSRGRQNRLIGQLLRAEDYEAIRSRVDSLKDVGRDAVQHEKESEAWLNRMIEEGDPAIEDLIEKYPHADRQQLRSLGRNARQKAEAKKAKRARRELLRTIRALRTN